MSYSKVCDGYENHCNLDPGEKPCKEKSAVRRESTQADNPRNKSLAYSMRADGGKVNE